MAPRIVARVKFMTCRYAARVNPLSNPRLLSNRHPDLARGRCIKWNFMVSFLDIRIGRTAYPRFPHAELRVSSKLVQPV